MVAESYFIHVGPDLTLINRLGKLPLIKFLNGLRKWQEGIPTDPKVWEFGGLQRKDGKEGTFEDADLVDLLQVATEHPAGEHTDFRTPLYLTPVRLGVRLTTGDARCFRGSKHSRYYEGHRDPGY